MAKDVGDLLAWLPSIAVFGGLGEATLRRIIGMMGEHVCEKGQEICRQGEPGRAMFVIRAGEVVVYREGAAHKRMKLVRMGPGEFFGEMTLIDIQTRSATVVVEKPSVLYSLGNRDLYRLFQEDVNGYVMVLQNLCRELSRRLRVTNERLQTLAEDADEPTNNTLIRPAARRPL